jgi:hypothetical protein
MRPMTLKGAKVAYYPRPPCGRFGANTTSFPCTSCSSPFLPDLPEDFDGSD